MESAALATCWRAQPAGFSATAVARLALTSPTGRCIRLALFIGGPLLARFLSAQVVELVDALASGASVRKDVKVRVLSWAPTLFN